MPIQTLSPEITELLGRVAEQPSGFRILYKGYLESVAVLFGVHPDLVETVRAMLKEPGHRDLVTTALIDARMRRSRGEPGLVPAADHIVAGPPSPETAEDLLREIGDTPTAGDFLFHAPLETIAILFSVHPLVVLEARGILKTRGFIPSPADEEDPLSP